MPPAPRTSPSKRARTVSSTSPVPAKRHGDRVADGRGRRLGGLVGPSTATAVAGTSVDRPVGDLEVARPRRWSRCRRPGPRSLPPSISTGRPSAAATRDSTSGRAASSSSMVGAEAAVAPRARSRRRSRPGASVSTAAADRRLGRGGQDRDEADQGHADHQGRRGGRGALGVALGVLPGQVAGGAGQPRCGRAEHVHRRAGDDRAEHEHADDGGERAEAEQLQGAVARRRRCRRRRRRRRRRGWPGRATVRRSDAVVLVDGDVAEGGDRGDPAGPEGRADGRHAS